jgi:ribosome biogenesis GTPase
MSTSIETLEGRLLKYHSNFYYVEAEGTLYECMLRGLIKKEGTEPLVGDRVVLDSVNAANQTARVSSLLPRTNAITRPKIANVDQVLVVYSLREPEFDPHQMDRYLTHIELAGLTPTLCLSKADLLADQVELAAIRHLYVEKLGYALYFTSIHQADSFQTIRELTHGKITVLAGPSGSGKSSLLNALNPSLKLRVGEISEKIARGQHTTRHVELLMPNPIEPDTLIADTPGFSNLRLNYVLPEQIEAVFREFAPYRADCDFSDCLHLDEEGCAVLTNRDKIADTRYLSYKDLITEARQYEETVRASSQKEEFGYKTLDRKGKDSVRILRLKEKDRDASRKTLKQQVKQMDTTEEDALTAGDGDFDFNPVPPPPESV